VKLNKDHSNIEAMDYSQRGDVIVGAGQRNDDVDYVMGRSTTSSSMNSSCHHKSPPTPNYVCHSRALPRDNDVFVRRGGKARSGFFQKASALFFGGTGKKTKNVLKAEAFKAEFRRKTNLMGDGEFEHSYSTTSSWNW
jgi:hypothetical protein